MSLHALIFGMGQDGHYLSHYLRGLGYGVLGADVFDMDRRLAEGTAFCDVSDATEVRYIVESTRPDEIYNLAGLVSTERSWWDPSLFYRVNTFGLINIMDAVHSGVTKSCRIFQASTSGMFGDAPPPQSEQTPFNPLTPYDGSKLAAHHLAGMYRRAYGMHVCCGILFPHSSPRQQGGVVKKVCEGIAAIKRGEADSLTLGNLMAVRDWGHAADYVRAMHLVLQQPAGDWVIGTGVGHTVRHLAETAMRVAGVGAEIRTEGNARAADAPSLVASPKKVFALGWKPEISFEDMLEEIIEESTNAHTQRLVPSGG